MQIRDGKWQTLLEVVPFGTRKVLIGVNEDGAVWVFGAPHVVVEMPISTKYSEPIFSNVSADEPGPRSLRVHFDACSERKATVVICDEKAYSVLDHHRFEIELEKSEELLKVKAHPPCKP